MANNLDRLLEGVTENPAIHASVTRLMHNIAAQADIAGGNNPAAALALATMLRARAEHIAASVLANTPVIAATPPVHPVPVDPDRKAPPPGGPATARTDGPGDQAAYGL